MFLPFEKKIFLLLIEHDDYSGGRWRGSFVCCCCKRVGALLLLLLLVMDMVLISGRR